MNTDLGTRKVWYTRDDSEGRAQSINHLMPPGTEASMVMPVFGFNGQVSEANWKTIMASLMDRIIGCICRHSMLDGSTVHLHSS